jgi:hypothetical protein
MEGCEAAVGVADAAVPLIGRDARRKLCSAYRGGDGGATARRERLSSAQLQPFERDPKIHRNRTLVPPGAGVSLSGEDWITMAANVWRQPIGQGCA